MEEVTFLCPNLKKVTFHVNRRYDNEHDELINVQELESLLKKESSCWSKVLFKNPNCYFFLSFVVYNLLTSFHSGG